jgi:hypothetical protein
MRRSSDSLASSRTHIDLSPLIVVERKEECREGTHLRRTPDKKSQEEIVTNQWLLPFTFGVDMQALDAALALVQKGSATLVALSLITVPAGKRSRGVRLEHIQQSQDFLETVKYRAARFDIPIERHEVYTESVLESLETLPHELGCEGMILLSRGGQALLLDSQEMQHLLSTVPVPLMLIHLPGQTAQSWLSHVMTRCASWLRNQKNTMIGSTIYNQKKSA